jgi:hypothetical protein
VLRVRAAKLARALNEQQTIDADLWLGRMRADFEATARDW